MCQVLLGTALHHMRSCRWTGWEFMLRGGDQCAYDYSIVRWRGGGGQKVEAHLRCAVPLATTLMWRSSPMPSLTDSRPGKLAVVRLRGGRQVGGGGDDDGHQGVIKSVTRQVAMDNRRVSKNDSSAGRATSVSGSE